MDAEISSWFGGLTGGRRDGWRLGRGWSTDIFIADWSLDEAYDQKDDQEGSDKKTDWNSKHG